MFPSPTRKTPIRRVSFSERIFYSDDPSTSTTSTSTGTDDLDDDESYGEQTVDSYDEETVDSVTLEEVKDAFEVTATSDFKVKMNTKDNKVDKNEATSIAWSPLDNEPPLCFRGPVNYTRPTDYLGGSDPEMQASPRHRVKLRKSWLLEDEDYADRIEFEEWKKTRSKNLGTGAKNGADEDNKSSPRVDTSNFTTFRSLSVCSPGNKVGDESNNANINEKEDTLSDPVPPNEEVTKDGDDVQDELDPKGTQDTKKTKAIEKNQKALKETNQQSYKPRNLPHPKKDPELDGYEMEVLEMKEAIAKLQRQLDVVEVRHISQLADLEEETTRRMREFRERASDVERKMRAKEEKLALKEKAMQSHVLIDQLRKSNQKLRAESVKIQEAVSKLKKKNQLLEEKNSFHVDYANQFLHFQEAEVSIAEEMDLLLNSVIPKYKELLRNMEEGVVSREENGQIECHTKELYTACMQSMLALLEDSDVDQELVDSVVNIMQGADDIDKKQDDFQSISIDDGVTISPSGKKGRKNDVKEEAWPAVVTPTRSAVRRSTSMRGRTPSASKNLRRRSSSASRESYSPNRHGATNVRSTTTSPQKWPSLRGTRMPKASKSVANDDDSSTCSITSVVSDTFSLDNY